MSELVHLYGETDGTSATGVFQLACDRFTSKASYIRIPKGVKAKIWCKRIAGAPVTVTIDFTSDVTRAPASWVTISSERLAEDGELVLEKRRPIVLLGIRGTEAFRVGWAQAPAAKSYVELEVELTDE